MVRSPRLLVGLVLGAAVCATVRLAAFVAAPPAQHPAQVARSQSRIALRARGGEDYTVTDADIEAFYQETLSGAGGLPTKGTVVAELIVKHFMGTFDDKGFTRASSYKGPPPGQPGKKDIPPAIEILKEQMKLGKYVSKGGPAQDEAQKVVDDGKGWVWLAADMNPGGLFLSLFTSVPYGKRPLLVAKRDQVDAMFEKVNWNIMDSRFDTTMGGPHIKQR